MSGNPASALRQSHLDDFPLASRPNIQTRRRLNPRCLRRSPFGKPQLINGKNISGAQDDGSSIRSAARGYCQASRRTATDLTLLVN